MELTILQVLLLVFTFCPITESRLLRPGAIKIYQQSDELLKKRWPWVRQKFQAKMQSPVNISTDACTFVRLPTLNFIQYWENEKEMVVLENTGHTVKLKMNDSYTNLSHRPMITGGPCRGIYVFAEMHMHWGENDNDGSEHLLDGQPFSCEMHIVHFNLKYRTLENALNYFDGLVVTGFFGDAVERDNPEIQEFIEDLKQIHGCHNKITVPVKPIFSFIVESVGEQNYYCYPGSLTTPKYQECAIWIIFTKAFEISHSQLKEFRQLKAEDGKHMINKNDRELQDFNNRPVLFSVGAVKTID